MCAAGGGSREGRSVREREAEVRRRWGVEWRRGVRRVRMRDVCGDDDRCQNRQGQHRCRGAALANARARSRVRRLRCVRRRCVMRVRRVRMRRVCLCRLCVRRVCAAVHWAGVQRPGVAECNGEPDREDRGEHASEARPMAHGYGIIGQNAAERTGDIPDANLDAPGGVERARITRGHHVEQQDASSSGRLQHLPADHACGVAQDGEGDGIHAFRYGGESTGSTSFWSSVRAER